MEATQKPYLDSPKRILSYRDLTVWQKAMTLVFSVHQLLPHFPVNEKYELTRQLRRSVVSVPLNIAEGHGRGTRRDYANFLSVAYGSLMETETILLLAQGLGYLNQVESGEVMKLITDVAKLLNALRSRLKD